ncbi:proteasome subunit alpha [Arthrobacter sp. Hiyo4]|nr:proteasome subunit alpha [Arthrobacter sp. Hiyo4]
MGGQAERVSAVIAEGWRPSLRFAGAVRLATRGLASGPDPAAEQGEAGGTLPAKAVEVAVLDRQSETSRGFRRAFRRLNDSDITALLAEED